MGVVTAITAGAALLSAGASTAGAIGAGKRAKRAGRKAARLEDKLEGLEKSRQAIINPFEGVTSLSSMIFNTSNELSNPYNNLSVATQAAEFQAEEADIALANTLDALQASGASAGGATALAQAALQSKRGISSSIEKQEAYNQKLRADGEINLQSARMNESIRVQGQQLGEARRIQQAEAVGKEFVYGERERREGEQLNRVQAQITGAQQQQVAERASKAGYISSGIGAVGDIAGSLSGLKGGGGKTGPYGGSGVPSDRRLKKNIKLIGISPSGINIYNFKYKNNKFGKGLFQGVMSDEIPENAVIKHSSGYDKVDYSKIDVNFNKV